MRVRSGLFALALCCTWFPAAIAQTSDRWEMGALPDDTLFEYPTKGHYEWLRRRVCSRGTVPQFSDCLVKTNLLESAWEAFTQEAFRVSSTTTRTEFAKTLGELYEQTERLDRLFPVGRLAR